MALLLLLASAGCSAWTRRPEAVRSAQSQMALNLTTLERAEASDASTEEAWRRGLSGFKQLPSPPALPISTGGPDGDDRSTLVWWPNLAGHDLALQRFRARYAGKSVWGYGGIAISCVPAWTRFYAAMTGVRVRSVERKYGVVDWVAGGPEAGAPYAYGIGFLGYAPLSFVVDLPNVGAVSQNLNYVAGFGMPGPCPNIELADFQVETKLSLRPPPFPVGAQPRPLHRGMSRDEVIWTRGYPEELATKSAMLRQSIWRYGGAMGRFTTVTFRHDRVISVYVPPIM